MHYRYCGGISRVFHMSQKKCRVKIFVRIKFEKKGGGAGKILRKRGGAGGKGQGQIKGGLDPRLALWVSGALQEAGGGGCG